MKAAYSDRYGSVDVVTLKDIPRPTPKDNEVLVKIVSTAVTAGDARIRAARFPKGFALFARLAFGIFKPRNKVLGSCFSGVVEATGKQVTRFKVGDEICGMTGGKMGTHAEYVIAHEDSSIAQKPENVGHDEAAGMLFGGTAALFFLRDKVHVSPGDKVVINGASGAVGTNAVQLAKHFGGEVTGVTSGDNAALVTSLGASHIIDYIKESLLESDDKYDVVLDAVGNIPVQSGLKLLTKDGRLVLMVASLGQMLSTNANLRILTGSAPEKAEDIKFLLQLLAEKKLKVVIDKVYSLEDSAQAHAHVDSGHKKGNVVVRV